MHHAELSYLEDSYFISDLGSRHGTFLKIKDKQLLTAGMVIEMGSYLFTVLEVGGTVLRLLYGCGDQQPKDIAVDFGLKSSFTIGRKSTADLYLEDQHLSGIHARLSTLHRQIIVEDMSSTNGTWIRLSRSGEKSQPALIEDRAVFKVGNTSTYTCRYRQKMEVEGEDESNADRANKCLGCGNQHIDGLLNPCKHNVCCYECSRQASKCPVCGLDIQEVIKIFI